MDASSIPAMTPPGADNTSVLLWAVPILIGAIVVLVRWAAASARKCEERSEKLEAKVDATQTLIQTRLFTTIEANTAALQANAESNDRFAETLNGLRMETHDRRR